MLTNVQKHFMHFFLFLNKFDDISIKNVEYRNIFMYNYFYEAL